MNSELLEKKVAALRARPGGDTVAVDAIHNWLLTAGVLKRIRINPYHIALGVDLALERILPELLHGVPLGLFDLYWDIRCPNCNMCTVEHDSLRQAQAISFCPMCRADFEVDFAYQVEVAFSLNPEIEHSEIDPPCPIPATHNPRYSMGIPRGQSGNAEHTFAAGVYRYFCPITKAMGILTVAGETTTEPQFFRVAQLEGPHYDITEIKARPGLIRIEFSNHTHPLAGFYVVNYELAPLRPEELPLRLSGLALIHFPDFWLLFSEEVLSNREQMRISAVTTLFTDITGSTQMYEKLGDVVAYNIVRDHFEILFAAIEKYGGTVLKTIGDAVMASFISNEQGIRSVLESLANFESYNHKRDLNERVNIKFGLHRGPAILVNLNSHLDYFGLSINKAARIQSLARSNEILFSQEVYEDERFTAVLQEHGITEIRQQSVNLKGINTEQLVCRASPGARPDVRQAAPLTPWARAWQAIAGRSALSG